MTSTSILVEADPVVPVKPEETDTKVGDAKVQVKAGCYVHVALEHFRDYPDSISFVHATLRNDEDELHNLHMKKFMMNAYRRERNRENSEERPAEET